MNVGVQLDFFNNKNEAINFLDCFKRESPYSYNTLSCISDLVLFIDLFDECPTYIQSHSEMSDYGKMKNRLSYFINLVFYNFSICITRDYIFICDFYSSISICTIHSNIFFDELLDIMQNGLSLYELSSRMPKKTYFSRKSVPYVC